MATADTARPAYRVRIATTFTSEVINTLRLGGPLALGELGWMSTYIVDALMLGRHALPARHRRVLARQHHLLRHRFLPPSTS